MVYIYYDGHGNISPVLHTSKKQDIENKNCFEYTEEEYKFNDMDLMNNYIYNTATNKIEKKLQLILNTRDVKQEQLNKQKKEIEDLKSVVEKLINKEQEG